MENRSLCQVEFDRVEFDRPEQATFRPGLQSEGQLSSLKAISLIRSMTFI
jgi:hypothetical protein